MIEPLIQQGYVVDRNYISSSQAKYFYEHALYMETAFNNSPPELYFSKDHHCQSNDSLFNSVLYSKIPYLEGLFSTEIYPTYNCYRNYTAFCIMRSHTDRDACEIGVSLCCGFPENTEPWPFCITDKKGQDHELILYPGDAVIYLGTELSHWRYAWGETWPKDGRHVQLFFHYVKKNGLSRSEAYDLPADANKKFDFNDG